MGEQEKDNIETEAPASENSSESSETTQAEPMTSTHALQTPNYQQIEEELKKHLEEKTKEAEANYNKFLRACADFENYKKRVEKEKGELINFSNERLLKELIPVVDNLERAIDHIEEESDLSAIKEGIKLVRDNLLAVLKKFGIEQLSAIGEKFDPTKHEAVNQEEASECEPGTVIKEFHKCYYLNNRLIRPAMVVTSKLPQAAPKTEEVTGGDD